MRRIVVSLIAIGVGIASAACSSNGSPECADPRPGSSMQMIDFEFSPTCLAVEGDEVALTNAGDVPHTFTVDGTDIDVRVEAGEEASAVVGALAPGTYAVRCTLHPQMRAAIRIA